MLGSRLHTVLDDLLGLLQRVADRIVSILSPALCWGGGGGALCHRFAKDYRRHIGQDAPYALYVDKNCEGYPFYSFYIEPIGINTLTIFMLANYVQCVRLYQHGLEMKQRKPTL